jgi:hypothetical protein
MAVQWCKHANRNVPSAAFISAVTGREGARSTLCLQYPWSLPKSCLFYKRLRSLFPPERLRRGNPGARSCRSSCGIVVWRSAQVRRASWAGTSPNTKVVEKSNAQGPAEPATPFSSADGEVPPSVYR